MDIGDQNDGGLAIGGADSVGLEAADALHDGSFARGRAQHRGVLAALCAYHGRSRGEIGEWQQWVSPNPRKPSKTRSDYPKVKGFVAFLLTYQTMQFLQSPSIDKFKADEMREARSHLPNTRLPFCFFLFCLEVIKKDKKKKSLLLLLSNFKYNKNIFLF